MDRRRVSKADLFQSPASFLAFGFGAGLAPVAPGTFGTLPGLLIFVMLASLPLFAYVGIVVLAFIVGVRICDLASRQLGVHDHGAIVWDEIIGMLITMIAIPVSAAAMVIGFLWFRLFDIWKPWPIRWIDKHVDGGVGIMVDDVIAGIFACGALHLTMSAFPVLTSARP